MKSAVIRNATLFFTCLLFHIAGTWSLPLIDRDEPRFAEASREMIERSDFIVPHFNDQLRLDKPPLAYWAQVVSYKIFGENDFAARFPSAIAAALAALAIFAWGSRIEGKRVGWWAAIIFTLSLQTFLHAKAAVADMWLVLFVTLAHWAGYELVGFSTRPSAVSDSTIQRFDDSTIRGSRQWWWIFYLALALAFLGKGPIGWMPLLTVASATFFASNLQLHRRFKFVRGILLMLAIVALWGIPALNRTQGEFFRIGIGRHVVARSFGAMEGHGLNSLGGYLLLLPFYFLTVFVSFFPWSLKLPWLVRGWRRTEQPQADPGYNSAPDAIDNYLISGVAIIFIIFTLLKTKLPHYTLPAFPLLSLLLARHWIDPAVAARIGFLKKFAVTFAIVWLVIALFVAPFGARLFFPAWQLYRESRDFLRPEMQFGAVDYNEPSLVWYFRSRVKGFLMPLNRNNASNFMATPGPRLVVMPTALAGTLLAGHPENWKIFSTRGFNIAKGKRVDLTLALKSE